jgi:hypothetical protein
MEPAAEALARLTALKSNLPNPLGVQEKYVNEFHQILDLLELNSGSDLSRFRVPTSELRPQVASLNRLAGRTTYTHDRRCDRNFLTMKIDGVLRLFELQTAGQKSRIGFRA